MARRANRNTYGFESVPGSDTEIRRLIKSGSIVAPHLRVESGHYDEVPDTEVAATTTSLGSVGTAGVMEPTAATALQSDPDADPNVRGAPAEGDQVETASATPVVDSTTSGPDAATEPADRTVGTEGTAPVEGGDTTTSDQAEADRLAGEALQTRARELEIEGRTTMTADELRAAVAEKEASGQ